MHMYESMSKIERALHTQLHTNGNLSLLEKLFKNKTVADDALLLQGIRPGGLSRPCQTGALLFRSALFSMPLGDTSEKATFLHKTLRRLSGYFIFGFSLHKRWLFCSF